MSDSAVYRFLPWTRRGLVAELRDSAGAVRGALPARATIKVDVTLRDGLGAGGTSTAVAGPGDVVGIDVASIVRLTPRRDATDVEPNYLVAVDFDDPDLPWMLTPAAANGQGQLRPWLVLIVVEARAGVTVSAPTGGPLPTLTIESGAQRELPDLDDSWAWGHSQVLVAAGSGATAAALQSDPDRHVSRLLCPRRLRANTDWIAALVPAFDAGVARGLGAVPQQQVLGPAWTDQDSIRLPLYFHWTFSTGADGDFESLARRLQPFVVGDDASGTPQVGTVRMHIGAAGGPVDLPAGHAGRIVEMDGALRAVQQRDGRLSDVPGELVEPLATILDTIAETVSGPAGGGTTGSATDASGAVGPPLYGSWAANRFAVGDGRNGWFAELNLDPRARVAAGLGAEVVRAEQEDLLQTCWQQVGDVLAANALLSRGRLSIESSLRLHAKTIARLGPEAVLGVAGRLAERTRLGERSVAAVTRTTSLPDATTDPAMRKLLAPTSRLARTIARHSSVAAAVTGVRFVSKLAVGTERVDPTRFVPSGVATTVRPTVVDSRTVDLMPLGIATTVTTLAGAAFEAGAAAIAARPERHVSHLAVKSDLRAVGLLTDAHVDAVRAHPVAAAAVDPLLALRHAAAEAPGSAGFLLDSAKLGQFAAAGAFVALDVDHRGSIVVRTPSGTPNEVIATVTPGLSPRLAIEGGLIPAGVVARGAEPLRIEPAVTRRDAVIRRGGDVVTPLDRAPLDRPVNRPVEQPGNRPADRPIEVPLDMTVVVPAPVRDAAVISRFEQALALLPEISVLAVTPPAAKVVAFPTSAATTALVARCHPAAAHTRRLGSMVRLGVADLVAANGFATVLGGQGIAVAPRADRIMAYPVINDAAYRWLAHLDRNRLLPGVDAVPPDSVTLLETNPRFVAGFLAGVNHELNRELLWRRYPTDQRGTPVRRFWDRLDGQPDIAPMHEWRPATRTLSTVAGGTPSLVLLIRGELLRRYPNTVVIAVKAGSANTPSTAPADARFPSFTGRIDPDISFFGFDLTEHDLRTGHGWFFALQEQVTEPRFALDEQAAGGAIGSWRDVAWAATGVAPGAHLATGALRTVAVAAAISPLPGNAATIADALFQNPVQVLVHARHLALTDGDSD